MNSDKRRRRILKWRHDKRVPRTVAQRLLQRAFGVGCVISDFSQGDGATLPPAGESRETGSAACEANVHRSWAAVELCMRMSINMPASHTLMQNDVESSLGQLETMAMIARLLAARG